MEKAGCAGAGCLGFIGDDVGLEVVEGRINVTEPVMQHTPFADEVGVPRFDGELEIDGLPPAVEVRFLAKRHAQIVQHALQHLAAGHG